MRGRVSNARYLVKKLRANPQCTRLSLARCFLSGRGASVYGVIAAGVAAAAAAAAAESAVLEYHSPPVSFFFIVLDVLQVDRWSFAATISYARTR